MESNEIHNGAPKRAEPLAPDKIGEQNEEVLQVRSPAVQEIIGRPPHWLVRGGIPCFLGVLILIFAISAVIKYPATITVPLRLTAINEPKTVESKINGKVIKLFNTNNTQVKKGQVLGWMESTARPRSVLELSDRIDSMYRWLQKDKMRRIKAVHIERFTNLGELQTDFKNFEQAYRAFITYLPGGFYTQKRGMIKKQLTYTRQLLGKLRDKKKLQEVNLRLAKQKLKATKTLASKNLIAPLDLAKAKSNMAAGRLPLEETESAIINNRATQVARQKDLIKLDQQIAEQRAVFRQALNSISSSIDHWKQKYLLTAPIAGKLIYAGIIQENQTLSVGQKVAYIKPDNTLYFGEVGLPQQSFGKVHKGQKVLVRFSGYPSKEFGAVRGRLGYISDFPVRDSVFAAKVTFQTVCKPIMGKS